LLLEKSFIRLRRFNSSILVVALSAVMVFLLDRYTYPKDGTRAVEFISYTPKERCTYYRRFWYSNEEHSISHERYDLFPNK
jgi:hypothetical protein